MAEKHAVYWVFSVRTQYVIRVQGKSQRNKPECRVNIMQEFSFYLTENTVSFHYNYRRLSDIHKSNRRLLWESYGKHNYTEYAVTADCTHSYHFTVES